LPLAISLYLTVLFIPGNDDTLESVQLYLHLFKQAILLGKKAAKEKK
jgi:ribosomal protein S2